MVAVFIVVCGYWLYLMVFVPQGVMEKYEKRPVLRENP